MNEYMNQIAGNTFSYFDTGKRASGKAEPERFRSRIRYCPADYRRSARRWEPRDVRLSSTGITRVSKESIFSDLNNIEVVTTTAGKYETAFGFTEEEVFTALDEFGMGEEKQKVKWWYDGFIFGGWKDIYNPWSILNLLDNETFPFPARSDSLLPAKKRTSHIHGQESVLFCPVCPYNWSP